MKTEIILEYLAEAGDSAIDFVGTFTLGYHSSYKKMWQAAYGSGYAGDFNNRDKKISFDEFQRIEKLKFQKTLFYLQKEGFVKKSKGKSGGKEHFWALTEKGLKRLKKIKESKKEKITLKNYGPKKSGDLKIVIFDIPESERRKRAWLRQNLVAFGFSKIQKSVWIGKTALPIQFIRDLSDLSLFEYVEIFSVRRIGTLKGKI